MERYTLKELREMVRNGYAQDITSEDSYTVLEIAQNSEKIGYACGTYGISGGMLYDRRNKKKYVIIGRCSNLFRVF